MPCHFQNVVSGIFGVPVEWVAQVMCDTVTNFCRGEGRHSSLTDIHLVDINTTMVKLIQGNFDQHNKSEPYIKARSGMRGMISGVRGVASNIMEGFGAMVGATAKESDPEEDSCPDDASYERNNRRRSNVSETGKKRGSIVMPREGQVGSRDLHKDTSDDEEKSSRSSAMSGLSDHTRRRGDTQSASGVSPSSGCPSRLYPDLSDGRRVSERDARREDDKGPSAARDHKTKSYAAAAQDGATRLAWNDDPNRVARKASGAAAAKGDTSEKDNECPICMDKLTNPKVLPNCKHKFCKGCIEKSFTHKQECPVCRMVYGKIQGTQPKNGRMETNVIPGSLPGYPCQTIVIQYNFPGGTQTVSITHIFQHVMFSSEDNLFQFSLLGFSHEVYWKCVI